MCLSKQIPVRMKKLCSRQIKKKSTEEHHNLYLIINHLNYHTLSMNPETLALDSWLDSKIWNAVRQKTWRIEIWNNTIKWAYIEWFKASKWKENNGIYFFLEKTYKNENKQEKNLICQNQQSSNIFLQHCKLGLPQSPLIKLTLLEKYGLLG